MSIKSPLQIQREEHDENLNAKKVSIASLNTWVTTAVTLTTLNTAYKLPPSEQAGRKTLVVYNISDTSIYFGDSSVTTTTGILLSSGSTLAIDAEKDIYAVCGTSGKIVNVLEWK